MRRNYCLKFAALLLSLALCLTLAACGNSPATDDAALETPDNAEAVTDTATPEQSGIVADTDDGEADSVPASVSGGVQTAGSVIERAALEHLTEDAAAPEVFFTSDISSAGLIKAYEALNWTPSGKTAVKLSTGEPPNSNYLRADLISDLIQSLNGAIVECNTA